MCAAEALPAGALYRRCDPAEIPFDATADAVTSYLADLEAYIIDSADDFLEEPSEGLEEALRRAFLREEPDGSSFQRFFEELLGRPTSDRELQDFDAFLGDLHEKGL